MALGPLSGWAVDWNLVSGSKARRSPFVCFCFSQSQICYCLDDHTNTVEAVDGWNSIVQSSQARSIVAVYDDLLFS